MAAPLSRDRRRSARPLPDRRSLRHFLPVLPERVSVSPALCRPACPGRGRLACRLLRSRPGPSSGSDVCRDVLRRSVRSRGRDFVFQQPGADENRRGYEDDGQEKRRRGDETTSAVATTRCGGRRRPATGRRPFELDRRGASHLRHRRLALPSLRCIGNRREAAIGPRPNTGRRRRPLAGGRAGCPAVL